MTIRTKIPAIVAAGVLAISLSACAASSDDSSGGSAAGDSTASAKANSPKPKKTKALTSGQKNAKKKAEQYLDLSAFSRKGLIGQLKFDDFTTSEATYAVDHIKANWNDQAEKKAKEYLGTQSFSRAGLVKQLEFDKFTPKQAKHGVSAAY